MVLINPGTEPLTDANEADARRNLAELISDAGLKGATVKVIGESGGRWDFRVTVAGHSVEVASPGCPMGAAKGSLGVWQQPRFYVDGNSWLWEFAVKTLRDFFEREAQS